MGASATRYTIARHNAELDLFECGGGGDEIVGAFYLTGAQLGFVSLVAASRSLEQLSSVLPYLADFLARRLQSESRSVLSSDASSHAFRADPSGYLRAIRAKYTVPHPVALAEEGDLRPWISGKMEKLQVETDAALPPLRRRALAAAAAAAAAAEQGRRKLMIQQPPHPRQQNAKIVTRPIPKMTAS